MEKWCWYLQESFQNPGNLKSSLDLYTIKLNSKEKESNKYLAISQYKWKHSLRFQTWPSIFTLTLFICTRNYNVPYTSAIDGSLTQFLSFLVIQEKEAEGKKELSVTLQKHRRHLKGSSKSVSPEFKGRPYKLLWPKARIRGQVNGCELQWDL